MKTEPNHPANPVSEEETDRMDGGVKIYSGLTKREHYAGLAMQGMISNLSAISREGFKDSEIAKISVIMSDALIAELNKEKP